MKSRNNQVGLWVSHSSFLLLSLFSLIEAMLLITAKFCYCGHHGLRVIARLVLTATGLVNGKWWLRRRPLRLCQICQFHRAVASTRVKLWRGRGRHQGAATRNKERESLFYWTTTLALQSASWVPAKSVQNQRNYRFKRKFMRKWRQLRLTDTVFVSLFEIIEASRRVHRFSSLRYRLACDDRNLTNSAGDIRYSVPGWPNIDAHMLPKAEKRLCTFKSPLLYTERTSPATSKSSGTGIPISNWFACI